MPTLDKDAKVRVNINIYLTDNGWKFKADIPDEDWAEDLPVVKAGAILEFDHFCWTVGPAYDNDPGLNFNEEGSRTGPEFLASELSYLFGMQLLEVI